MYKYETHCHTSPVSFCGRATPEETVWFYRSRGYDGLFITNHFLDGNIDPESKKLPFHEQIGFYFTDFEKAYAEGKTIGIKVFPAVELSCKGTDFLIYGLCKDWYLSHPEIVSMEKTEELQLMKEAGAFIVQAHPYREAHYIDHIRLFPRSVHAVEVINSSQAPFANDMAHLYAEHYHLMKTAGSDNHHAARFFEHSREKGYCTEIAGIMTEQPLFSPSDYASAVMSGEARIFTEGEHL